MSAAINWMMLGYSIARLWHRGSRDTATLVRNSYDALAQQYDIAWTNHMRDLTDALLGRLIVNGEPVCIDLTCGTGYATGQLLAAGASDVTGVDAAGGMLAVARSSHPRARFVQADVLTFLGTRPERSADVITCCWGLGYSRPEQVIRECARILRPRGQLAIIDNSLWSLREMVWTSIRAFARHPQALSHSMRVRFLPSSAALVRLLKRAEFNVTWSSAGERGHIAQSGLEAINRLRSTGAAAGFEFASLPESREAVYATFASLLEQRYGHEVPIVHRYIAAIARKGEA